MSIYKVSNAVQLQAALAKAVGGDRVVLASGSYGTVYIQDRFYSSAVVIESASKINPAHFDGLHIKNARNLTISGLDLGRGLKAGESDATALNGVVSSKNIVMTGVKIHGSLDGNPTNDGVGLVVRDTTGFVINSSSFEELHRGAFVQRGWIVNFNNNDFNKMRSDGINVAATKSIYIGGNTFKNFAPINGDHGDAIQFWNKNEKSGSAGITIRDNVLMQTSNGTVQGIFMSDANGFRYKDINIQNNLFYSNGAYHGIHVTQADRVNVSGNTVVSQKGDAEKLWIYLTQTTGLVVKDNISDHVRVENNASPIVANNASLHSNSALANLFANLNTPKSVADLIAKGYGYLMPGTSRTSTVSGVKAVDIGLDMSGSSSAVAEHIPVPVSAPLVQKQIVPLPMVVDLEPIGSTPAHGGIMHSAVGHQWFTALP